MQKSSVAVVSVTTVEEMQAAVRDILASGMYLLRMVLMDGQNKPTQISNTRKLA